MKIMEKQRELFSNNEINVIRKKQTTKKRILSASSINTYLQCPRKFFYQYIKKLPTKDSIYLLRGSIVHEVLEDFYDLDDKLEKTNFDEIKDWFLTKIKETFSIKWKQNEEKLMNLGLDNQTLMFFFNESILMLENWTKIIFNKIQKVMNEKKINFNQAFLLLKPIRESYYKSDKMKIHGYIDAIHEFDNKIIIIDYKTSKSSELKDTYKLQLGLYALLYQEKHNKFPDEVGLFFLKDKELLIKPNENLIIKTLEKLNYVKNNTETEDISNYPMNPTKLCKWKNAKGSGQCDFYEYCFENKETK